MRLTLILLLISFCSFGQATFHSLLTDGPSLFVSLNGSGAETGRQPNNSMAFADFLNVTIASNTQIFFNRGEEYNLEDYDLTVPATFNAYGSGADPVFYGSDDISGLTWTADGGLYYTPMATEPKWVWIDGECAKNAETARITVAARSNTTTAGVANGTLDVYDDIVGAYLIIKEKNFQNSQRVTITNFNKTTDVITFDGPIPQTSNVDLVAYNDVEFFSGNNEWVWADDTLWVKAAASPSTMNIRATNATYGIKSTATIGAKNCEFKEYYTAAIWTDGSNPVVDECYFHDIRDNAMIIQRPYSGVQINDNVFERIGNNGVLTRPLTDSFVLRNTFTDIGMQDNYNFQTWFDGDGSLIVNNVHGGGNAFAMFVDLDDDTQDGENVTVEYNVITNVANRGISLGLGTNNTIRYNRLSGFGIRYHDGGGIYLFHYRAYNVFNENNEIAYNIVTNEGTTLPTFGADGLSHATFGIYLDNRTRGSNIHHNTVYSVYATGTVADKRYGGGIFMNVDTENHTVEYNNIFDCSIGIMISNSDDGSLIITDNIDNQFNNNTIATGIAGQYIMLFQNFAVASWNPFDGTGGADNNAYCGNISPVRFYNTDESPEERTFAQLQADFGQDASSVLRTNVADIEVNATAVTSNEDGQSDYIDLFSGSTLTTYTIDPYYSKVIGRLNYSNTLTAASSQYFNAGTTADIQFTNASSFAIAFWFKIASNPSATQHLISNQAAGTSRGYGISMTTSGTFIVNLINTVSTNRAQYTTAVDVADNTWHHFMFNYPGTPANGKIYIDGVDAGTVASNNLTSTIASTSDLLICALTGPANYWNGLIDEVAIWNSSQAANADGIENNRPQEYLRRYPPLHYWHMGKSASLNDVGTSASPLNLTAVNSPTNSTDTKQ